MSKIIMSEDIRDTNEVSATTNTNGKSLILRVENGLDAAVTVDFKGTYLEDLNFTNAELLLENSSIASGENGYVTVSDPWEQIGAFVTADTTPTSGTLVVRVIA